jgi:hypothetical protein
VKGEQIVSIDQSDRIEDARQFAILQVLDKLRDLSVVGSADAVKWAETYAWLEKPDQPH